MRCPKCQGDRVAVYGTEQIALGAKTVVRRWRRCESCGARWRTFEEWDGRAVRERSGPQQKAGGAEPNAQDEADGVAR